MGVRSLLADLGLGCRLRMFTDSTAGKAIVSRRGLGRVRHIEVSDLWAQANIQDGTLEVTKLKNKYNSADLFTKHLSFSEILECVRPLGGRLEEGRHHLAPEITD